MDYIFCPWTEEDLSKELDLQIKGAEKSSVWGLLGSPFHTSTLHHWQVIIMAVVLVLEISHKRINLFYGFNKPNPCGLDAFSHGVSKL
ncbi:hypothetical protein RJ641_001987 [Dillenia turbinata]|uniref:Uncharacterized protein n=1 Tax=Dillenia turbinata TaxID=194707 RepID=A0AAN8VCB5_9MAGN